MAEVALVGWEGMTGASFLSGAGRSPNETFMQIEGAAHCITMVELRNAMKDSASLSSTLHRYAHFLAVQMAHTALANAQGKIEERLARWLLMAQDRTRGDILHITHEFLALMLGVRRAGVTAALHLLEEKALIEMNRANCYP
jgi:CRP-like cAMP-binding protein